MKQKATNLQNQNMFRFKNLFFAASVLLIQESSAVKIGSAKNRENRRVAWEFELGQKEQPTAKVVDKLSLPIEIHVGREGCSIWKTGKWKFPIVMGPDETLVAKTVWLSYDDIEIQFSQRLILG